jgi:DnaJ-class molecular chaperone
MLRKPKPGDERVVDSLIVDDEVLYDECPACEGYGEVPVYYYDIGKGDYLEIGAPMECPACDGSGRVAREG